MSEFNARRVFSSVALSSLTIVAFAADSLAKPSVDSDRLFQKIEPKTLCEFLKAQPDAILIDVRTPEEFTNRAIMSSQNIGALQNAVNIELRTIQKDKHVLEKYKDKKIVLYCSHSRRSLIASRLMAKRGYTNIYNLSGGMSVVNEAKDSEAPCLKGLLATPPVSAAP